MEVKDPSGVRENQQFDLEVFKSDVEKFVERLMNDRRELNAAFSRKEELESEGLVGGFLKERLPEGIVGFAQQTRVATYKLLGKKTPEEAVNEYMEQQRNQFRESKNKFYDYIESLEISHEEAFSILNTLTSTVNGILMCEYLFLDDFRTPTKDDLKFLAGFYEQEARVRSDFMSVISAVTAILEEKMIGKQNVSEVKPDAAVDGVVSGVREDAYHYII